MNILLLFFSIYSVFIKDVLSDNLHDCIENGLNVPFKNLVPDLNGKSKGDSGKVGIIGGSVEYTGAPYFAAISALKVGADLVYVITTEGASPVIKSYSPDLIVYPYLNYKSASKISSLLQKMDVIVIGPGLGREDSTLGLFYDIINTSKSLRKPLVIDADGLYAISKNPAILKNYPSPGVILTPNKREADKLLQATTNTTEWYNYWGDNVSVLVKGEKDQFLSSTTTYKWSSSEGGSGRRAGGQGDILSGSLGTIYSWTLKTKYCNIDQSPQLAQSLATHAAARLTRSCNSKAYKRYGRNMIASDMLAEIHEAFEEISV